MFGCARVLGAFLDLLFVCNCADSDESFIASLPLPSVEKSVCSSFPWVRSLVMAL